MENNYWRYYQHNFCMNITGFYADKEHYDTYGYTIIPANEFIIANTNNMITKEKEVTELPELFAIEGKNYHIAAMVKDLNTIGYTNSSRSFSSSDTIVGINLNFQESNLQKFRVITTQYDKSNFFTKNWFNLPEQYSEALQFAKEQINHPYWNKKKEETITIGSNNTKVTIYPDNRYIEFEAEEQTRKINVTIVEKLVQAIENADDLSILGYSTQVLPNVRFLRIGCTAENNLFSLDDLNLVINTWNKLNK